MCRFSLNISLMVIFLFMAGLSFAKINPEDVEKGHVYLFEDIKGNTVKDSSKANLNGTIRGAPKSGKGINGQA